MDPTVKIEMDKICRVCNASDGNLENLFIESEINSKLNLPAQIMACCTVEVFANDGLPNKICQNCATEVQKAYQFKIRCEQNDEQMREYLRSLGQQIPVSNKKKAKIKQECSEGYEINIKPEITLIEDEHNDPLNQLWKNLNVDKGEETSDDDDEDNSDYKNYEESTGDDGEKSGGDTKEKSKRKSHSTKNDGYNLDSSSFTVDKDGKYECTLCDKKLADKKGLKLHLRLHTGEKLKVCKICDRGFLKPHHLMRHMETHNHKCDECDQNFLNINEYRNHMKELHPTAKRSKPKKIRKEVTDEMSSQPSFEDKIIKCLICETKFKHIYEIRNHLHEHLNVKTFENIDLQTKDILFDPTRIVGAANEPKESLINYITNEIAMGDKLRLYEIYKCHTGQEMNLTDSETEDEGNSVDNSFLKSTHRLHHCSLCQATYDRIDKIMDHIGEIHAADMDGFKDRCSVCQKVFPNEFILNRHFNSQCGNQQKAYKCEMCNVKFMWEHNLQMHRQQCGQLPVSNITSSSLSKDRYRTTDTGELVCELCQKTFLRYEYLKRHMQTHVPNERKFECPECHKKFNRKDNLRSHLKTHSKDPDMPLPDGQLCVYCGRNFSNSSNLIVHMRRHTGEKPYKCEFCEKGFPRSSDLQCHRRTHTGEKPCLCTICGKGFSRSNKLVRHMRIHTGVRPYQCPHCDRAFTQSNDLTLHIRRHTGERPYVCGVCGERFIQGTALKAHQKAQQHFDDTKKESPFASISVNNPNRFSNTNHVARVHDGTPLPVKTVRSKSQKSVKALTVLQPPPPPVKLETQISVSNDAVGIGDRSNHSEVPSVNDLGGFSVPFPIGLSSMPNMGEQLSTLFTITQYNQSHYQNHPSHHGGTQ